MATRTMTMPSALGTPDQSLPPLHQAIPEFHSHNPHERRSSSMPRRFVDLGSPSFRALLRLSPSPSSALSDTSTSRPAFPSPKQHRAVAPAGKISNTPLTARRTVTTSSDPTEVGHEAQSYMFPTSTAHPRRMSAISASSSSYADARPSPYLPPVTSLASSRGSSFDMDPTDRPHTTPVTLPSIFRNPQSAPPSATQPNFPSTLDSDPRYPHSTQDYHRYASSPAISSAYRAPSPVQQYSSSQYYSHSYPQAPRTPGYVPRQSLMIDTRSPFSPGGHPDMSMDHFDHNRPGKRRRGNLPKHVTDLLRSWLNDHLHHPYPTEDEKQMLMAQTGLTINQISNWFINARRRRLPSIAQPSRTEADLKTSHSLGGPGSSH
ncbi:homeodomain superfamily [Rhizina undulata]